MKETTLVVLAAGMGSRFGGTKQIAPLGPNGEILIEFSIFDAVRAGFNKVVMIIKKENEEDIRKIFSRRIDKMVPVTYVYQDISMIPEGYSVPEGRTKPWGTAHAILCAADAVDTPFGIINADDFYGYESFKILHDHLVTSDEMCNVGFRLGTTLTEFGSVSRGVCSVEDGYLSEIVEMKAITKDSGVPLDSVCSMNMWGLFPDFFVDLKKAFIRFLDGIQDGQKEECYLPIVIGDLVKEKGAKVRVLSTPSEWFGVTYREDIASVKEKLQKLVDEGRYKGL